MSDIKHLTDKIVEYRDERDWKQFHNPKDLAISLSLETAEVLEHFQWKNNKEMTEHILKHKQEIGEELADVLAIVLLMAFDMKIDVKKTVEKKLEKNKKNYPIDKARGRHDKYTTYKEDG